MTTLSLLFGLAIFLFAMHSLERGIRVSSGNGLKRWIANRTNTAVSAAGYGVLVTAIMQSSSMVSLVVLAFVSAEVIPLFNGIGVVLGANLGTTVTGWVVTIVGFKMNLQAMVVPLLGLGAALSLGYINNSVVKGVGTALFAFGLLIFGLDIMKTSVAGLAEMLDISSFKDLPAWVYLLIGLVMAAVMQSSSAVMIIALTMLNSDIVQLSDAAAIVIGADLGTTSTTVLGSVGQSTIKKQLAFAHVFFNVLVNALAFIFLLPVLPELLDFFAVTDAMFGLVTFHSTFNLMGLVIFLPILKYYTRWIQHLLPTRKDRRAHYFAVPVEVPEAAIDSLSAAFKQLGSDAVRLHLMGLGLGPSQVDHKGLLSESSAIGSFEDQYESLKAFEGDLIRYAGRLQLTALSKEQAEQVAAVVEIARAVVYASKTLKDVLHDFERLRATADESLGRDLGDSHNAFLIDLFSGIIPLLFSTHDALYVREEAATLSTLNNRHRHEANEIVSRYLAADGQAPMQVSTWFNLNHELHHYTRYMLSAVAS